MTWFAQVAPTTNLGDYALGVFGAYALAMFILVAIIVYLVRQNKQKDSKIELQQTENKALLEARIQDAKDFAKLDAKPNEELRKFIATLFDVYNHTLNDKQGQ